ncbi:MAG: OmpA family protein [Myxococcota bacterium]|nr:OmpA family protein [Myxococcota bacterium]
MYRFSLSLALSLLALAPACKKPAPPPPAAEEAAPAEVEAEPTVDAEPNTPDHVQQMTEALKRTFFELDSANLTDDASVALDVNAELLRQHTDIKLEIQGHADERGTTEYNLALGQKRAQAVYDHLVNAGIGTSRLSVISYGEESPLTVDSTEQAWSQNRRAEFRITWGSQDQVKGTIE